MNLRHALSRPWLPPLLLATVVLGVGLWARHSLHASTAARVESLLLILRDANASALETWITAREREVALIAANSDVVELASQLRAVARRPDVGEDSLRAAPEQDAFRQALTRLVLDTSRGAGIGGVASLALFDASGQTLGSLDPASVGHRHPVFDRPELTRILGGEALLLHPLRVRGAGGAAPSTRIEMFVAAPVREINGNVVAVLVLGLRPDEGLSDVLNRSRFATTGETYAFDKTGQLLTRSRFEADLRHAGILTAPESEGSILNVSVRDPGAVPDPNGQDGASSASWPLTAAARAATEGQTGSSIDGYRDYRGVQVVGAWTWLERHGLGLVTELDREEAFANERVLRQAFDALLALLVLPAAGLLVYGHMTQRLQGKLRTARQLGHYTLEEKLGQGGMGTVYRARHALLRRPTVIKLIRPDRASQEVVQRFEREVQLTSSLTHPNTISIYDYGHTPDGTFYYVMEHLDGLDLDRVVQADGSQPERRVVHILRQAFGSLAEAHSVGLVHRDLKPANLMLCVRGLIYDWIEVLDFGLVKDVSGPRGGDSLTQLGMITGTPLYMAPEMFRSPDSADQRVDIYAMGAVAYVLLTGRQPFAAPSLADILAKQLSEDPVAPSTLSGRPIHPDMDAFVLACLSKAPERRPANGSAALAQLDHISGLIGEWTQDEARRWWETVAPDVAATSPGAMSTGLDELEIELGGRATPTRVAAPKPPSRPRE